MDTGLHYPLNVELLPPGWYSGYIGEFSDEIQSGFACGQHSDDNIGVSHLRPMNVSREGKIDLSVLKYVAASYDGRRLKEGDVLFNNTNSPELIGKTAYVDESVSGLAFSNHMTAIRLCGAVYPKFAAYQLHFLWMARYYLHKCVKHVNQASISSTELGKTIPFLVPPLNEQHRIVAKIEELLSELDKGIESLKTAREQLRVYRQAVLKHAFEGTLTAHWREGNKNRLESSKSIIEHILKTRRQQWREKGKYKEPQTPDAANLSDLPPGWVWVTVDHLLTETLMNGHSVRDSTNGFPVLRLTALKSGRIDLSERKKGDWTEKDAEPYLVSQGDFYVSRGNGSKKLVGIGGLVVEKPEPIAFPDTFIRIRINSNMCDINYLSLLWNSHLLRSQIEKCARTTAGIYKINQGHICSFIIPLPSIEEQKEIIYQLEDVLSKISNLENSCETESVRSETLRQSILKKAFSGKPTVSLGVTCAVVDTYGCDNGRIAPTRCAIIAAGLDGK